MPRKHARADDLADQAELEFSLGADYYQRADYKLALEHFLISNRLVANKNVVFNIARCYEQLKSYPAAFRYYSQALEGETDLDARSKISNALAQIKQYVTVLGSRRSPRARRCTSTARTWARAARAHSCSASRRAPTP